MKHQTQNHLIFITNPVLFMIGFALMSPVTILPLFVSQFTESNILIGSTMQVQRLAWSLPLIYGAHYFSRHPFKARRIVIITTIGRLLFTSYCLLILLTTDATAEVLLLLFFLAQLFLWGSDGFTSPAWSQLLGTLVDRQIRGRVLGVSVATGGAIGALAIFIATQVLGNQPDAKSFARMFIFGTLFLQISHQNLGFLKESPTIITKDSHNPLWEAGNLITDIIRQDAFFRKLVAARVLIGLGVSCFTFVTVYGITQFNVSVQQIGLFTTFLLVSQTVGFTLCGFISDRFGALGLASLGGAFVLLVALLSATTSSTSMFVIIFICVGIATAALGISDMTLILEFISSDKIPSYFASYHVIQAPINLLAALSAGLLVDIAGFRPMFTVCAIVTAVGIVIMFTLRTQIRKSTAVSP